MRNDCDLSFIMPVIRYAKFTSDHSDGKPLTDEESKHICENLKFRFYKAGEYVMKKGDHGDEFFTIIKGKVQVLIPKKKKS
jgi:CRP-like cAMP-binding protein